MLCIPCEHRSFKTGLVCVCNATYCDTLEFSLPKKDGEVLILSSSKGGLRFQESRTHFNDKVFTVANGPYNYGSTKMAQIESAIKVLQLPPRFEEPLDSVVNVSVNRTATYQKIIGFGGAFTGAVSHNLDELQSPELRRQVYRSYYSKDVGIGFNMMRMSIGGCDFDLEPWAYNEYPEHDPLLSTMKAVDKRDLAKLEQIKELKKVSKNHDIKVIGAAWSPPTWMKTNGDWTGYSALRDEYYQTWADYHVRYLELMNAQNFSFWAISTGNEPLNGVIMQQFVRFMSLGWLPSEQGKWLAENLGPSMKKTPELAKVKILAGDDQRYTFPWWFEKMYEGSPDVTQYIDGLALHWYADLYRSPEVLDDSIEKYPGKFIISTEASYGDKPWQQHKPVPGSWFRAEEYILDIMEDLNHWVSAWVDWNLILDPKGGPNYARNFVDSAMIANETEILKQPIFYALGHFSRFIVPDSIKIRCKSSHKFVKTTAFLRPDGYVALVIYNL